MQLDVLGRYIARSWKLQRESTFFVSNITNTISESHAAFHSKKRFQGVG